MASNVERRMKLKTLQEKTRLQQKRSVPPKAPKKSASTVSKPIENPELKKAISTFTKNRNHTTWRLLQNQLNRASYLIPFIDDEVVKSQSNKDDSVIFEKGSLIKFISCNNDKGEPYVPAFTDWDEIRKWTSDNVATWVMSPADLWDFALHQDDCKGVVINRAEDYLALEEEHITVLKKQI